MDFIYLFIYYYRFNLVFLMKYVQSLVWNKYFFRLKLSLWLFEKEWSDVNEGSDIKIHYVIVGT
jgi:hypothetical protein